jgi:hypothetical protein
MNPRPQPAHRVSAVTLPAGYKLPEKPEGASSGALDTYRQTSFVLGGDLRLFAEGMDLQLRILHNSSHSSFRNHRYAAIVTCWSRTYSLLSDGCVLLTRGSYGSCAPLVRAACESIAAQQQLHATGMDQFLDWLGPAFQPDQVHKAIDVPLGSYSALQTLTADDRLRRIYQLVEALSRPNFGATLLQVGPESNNRRLALVFADDAFHVAWAELTLGWLLALCERQLAVVAHATGVFAFTAEAQESRARFASSVEAALNRPERCRIEEVTKAGRERYLMHNVRRQPSGAPKKVLL